MLKTTLCRLALPALFALLAVALDVCGLPACGRAAWIAAVIALAVA